MFDSAAYLRRTIRIDAAPNGALITFGRPGRARHFGAALGTGPWEMERRLFAGPPREHHVHHGGNDFAGLFDGHSIAEPDVFLADVLFIVQGGAANGAAR